MAGNRLPVEVITHIMRFLSVSDRKEACLVNKIWYEAYSDPVIQRDIVVTFHSHSTYCKEPLSGLRRRQTPNLVLNEIDDSNKSKDMILMSCQYLSENLQSLSLKGCEVSVGTFMTFISQCCTLVSLDLSCCNNLFMTGTLLQNAEERENLQKVLENVRYLNLSGIRFLSDVTFNRMVEVCCNIESLSLASSRITFNSDPYKRNTAHGPSASLLTFENIMNFIEDNSNKINALDFSRTSINDEALLTVASTKGLKLQRLVLHTCRELGSEGVMDLCKTQKDLEHLDLAECFEVGNQGAGAVMRNLSLLKFLRLEKCRYVTDEAVKGLYQLHNLVHLDLSACHQVTSKGLIRGICEKPPTLLAHLNLNCCSYVNDSFVLEACRALPQLVHLDLGSCFPVSDVGVNGIAKHLPALRFLRLAWCKKMTDYGLTGLIEEVPPEHHEHDNEGQCKCTRKANVSNIFNPPKDPHTLENGLLKLSVERTADKLRSGTVTPLSNLKALRSLDISNCPQVTDAGLVTAIKFQELKYLNLSFCPDLTDATLKSIAKHNPSLESVCLSRCNQITDAGIMGIGARLQRLSSLEISGCDKLTDISLQALGKNCHRLKTLDVSYCSGMTVNGVSQLEARLKTLVSVKKACVGAVGDTSRLFLRH